MTNIPIRVILADDHAVVRAGIRQFLEHAQDIDVVAEADDGELEEDGAVGGVEEEDLVELLPLLLPPP